MPRGLAKNTMTIIDTEYNPLLYLIIIVIFSKIKLSLFLISALLKMLVLVQLQVPDVIQLAVRLAPT